MKSKMEEGIRNYIRYNPKPVPESHVGLRKRRDELRSARRHRLEERTRAMESLERTKPQISEYERFHLAARLVARRFDAAVASLPMSPSTEKTSGVKVRRLAIQRSPYLVFFSFS